MHSICLLWVVCMWVCLQLFSLPGAKVCAVVSTNVIVCVSISQHAFSIVQTLVSLCMIGFRCVLWDRALFNHNIIVLICWAVACPSEGLTGPETITHTHCSLCLSLASLSLLCLFCFLCFFISVSHGVHMRPISQAGSSCVAVSLSVPVHQPIIHSVSKSTTLPECPLFHSFLLLHNDAAASVPL